MTKKTVYYKGGFLRAMFGIRIALQKYKWLMFLRFPIALFILLAWGVFLPLAYVLVIVGDVGHRVAHFFGFDSSEWGKP